MGRHPLSLSLYARLVFVKRECSLLSSDKCTPAIVDLLREKNGQGETGEQASCPNPSPEANETETGRRVGAPGEDVMAWKGSERALSVMMEEGGREEKYVWFSVTMRLFIRRHYSREGESLCDGVFPLYAPSSLAS